MAEQCDYLLTYEWDTYHAQRPIAYTNWPTLDPLSHPTEPTLEEEQRLRRRYGFPPNPRLKEYDNDRESLVAMLVRTTPADLAGYFASYHAYPYYPDFIDLDSAYGAAGSAEGRSRYFGYLHALKQHHAGRPLLIAEYGVPSSRGVSHLQSDGMGHGGHDERAMADIDARLTREVREAGAAGGILFAWLDEWFKHTWVTIDLEVPADRTRLWHNVENAEQHYGLMGEYAGPADRTPEPGGAPAAWQALPVLERGGSLVLRVGADPSYLYVALAGRPEFDAARYVIGIDTYRRDRGQFRLPGEAGPTGEVGCEFALVLNDTSDAQLMVAPWYNPFLGPRGDTGPTGLDRFYNQAASVDHAGRDGAFDSLFVTTNRWRIGRSGRTYAARGVNRGRLRYGRAAESSLADWYVDRAAGLVEVRIAWGLLNVTDPSSRRVMVRHRRDGTFETAVTEGFRFEVAALHRSGGGVVARLGAGQTYAWPTWAVPTWHERLKPAYAAMRVRFPDRADALAGRARAIAWSGDLDRAEELWRRALERHADNPELLIGLAQTLYWKGQPGLAETYAVRARAVAPEDRTARDLERVVRAALRPEIATTVDGATDSDRNAFVAQQGTIASSLGSDLRGTVRAGWRHATDQAGDGSSYWAGGHLIAALGHGAVLRAGVGARRVQPDVGAARTPLTAELGVGLRPARYAAVSMGYSRTPFGETAGLR